MSGLDNTASEIVTYQRDSTVQRKELAQKTKDFRKLDDASKLGEIKGLLKGSSTPRVEKQGYSRNSRLTALQPTRVSSIY